MTSETLYSASAAAHPAVAAIRACPFDLVARAELALDGCTRLTDPQLGGLPYCYAEFHTDPPIALHAAGGYSDTTGRLLEALTLAHIMTGTPADARDEAYVALLRTYQRENGLMERPAAPWTQTAPVVEMEWSQRAPLLAWMTRYLALDDTDALQRAQRLVHALYKHVIWEGDTCWLPASYLPEKGWVDRFPPIGRMTDVLIGGQVVFPLARFAGVTGNEEALHVARGLIRFLIERSGAFDSESRFTRRSGYSFHSKTAFILGVLKYGLVSGHDEYVDWACAAYHYAREWGTEFGFFPDVLVGHNRWQGDASATADMIEIALLLGLHKDPSYLSEAERYGRNHLLESQILDFNWVDQRLEAPFCQEVWCAHHPPEGVTIDDVCGRSLGSFASWSRPNDAFDPTNPRLARRSTGAGTRALYDLWHYAVTRPEGAVMVNLHFSRDTRWATVRSLAPQTGGVEVMVKTRGVLAVRVPPHVHDPHVLVNHVRPRHEVLRHGYAWLEALQAGDVVSVTWPQDRRSYTYTLEGITYTATWWGDTLLEMDPPGELAPLYRRVSTVLPAEPRNATGPVKEVDTL
ncbi:MAG TPA: hypothetical protein VFB38_13775 [Chthonomonadaceae bacterium]|nr:hypothetical protein [Chthonomonadaceae bacterium]